MDERQERWRREVWAHVEKVLAEEADVMEALLAWAVTLQDYDMLDRLHIVDQWDHHRAVASSLA